MAHPNEAASAELPTGTVTFLFTDLEGSTRLWEAEPEAMKDALARHDEILHDAIERHGGAVFSTMGDGVAAVFSSAPDALRGVIDAQRRLGSESWGPIGSLRARMGLHSDEGRFRAPGQYVNRPLNRCARVMAIAHGGQVLVSESTAALARESLPEDAHLIDLGEHRLRDLTDALRVFQLAHPELRAEFPPLRSLDVLPGNLPRQTSTFIGREREVEQLVELVRERPLVTLTGVGGVGKTRLALQAAAEVMPEFPHGAWFCELAPVPDPDAVWDVIAIALGVRPSPGRGVDASVLEYLASKRLLFVLDNCEHLLDMVAHVVDAIGRGCPEVCVLATSREGLALAGEQIVAVPSLDTPDDDAPSEALIGSASVRLFVDRAQRADHDFELTERNAAAVAQLCRRLDGIPLAIELAAARSRSLTPEDLVKRLDQRFKLLTRGSRAGLERHQTLRSTIDWSYELLEPDERRVLERMSVFAGGCDLAGAEAVVADDRMDGADVADLLGQLVDKSLVLVAAGEDGTRYWLLETIRQYAAERLEETGGAPDVRRRHADHYVQLAERAGPHLRGRDQLEWTAIVDRESDNLRAAFDWAVETQSADHALRLVASLAVYGLMIGIAAMEWGEIAAHIPGSELHPLFPMAVAWAAHGVVMGGDNDRGIELAARAREVQERLGTHHPWVLAPDGVAAFFRGDFQHALARAQAWTELARSDGDPYEVAQALVLLGAVEHLVEPTSGIDTLEEAVRFARLAGAPATLSIALAALAGVLSEGGEVQRALPLFDESIEVGTLIGDFESVANALSFRGWIDAQAGEWSAALHAAVESGEHKLRIGDQTSLYPSYALGGVALVELGALEGGTLLLGAATRPRDFRFPDQILALTDAALTLARTELGQERFNALVDRGARCTATESVALMRAEADRILERD